LEKTGENKLVKPNVFVEFWITFWTTSFWGLEFGLVLPGTYMYDWSVVGVYVS